MEIRTYLCGNENNIINCINDVGGFFVPMALFWGVIGLLSAPFFVYRAFSSKEDKYGLGSKIAAIILAFGWGLSVFFIVPGFAFCSVFCFLGIGLPFLGITLILYGTVRIIAYSS